MLNVGVAIGGITTDFDNEPRSTGTSPTGPDIGADEKSVLQEFRLTYFPADGGANNGSGANDQDPDGDGLTNLEEFAYGTNPIVGNANVASFTAPNTVTPGSPTTMISTSQFAVDYFALFSRRSDYVAAGLTYTVQFTADLSAYFNSLDTPTVRRTTAQSRPSPYRIHSSSPTAKRLPSTGS